MRWPPGMSPASESAPRVISFKRLRGRELAPFVQTIGTLMTWPSWSQSARMARAMWSVTRTSQTLLHSSRLAVPPTKGR
eukprot:3092932-Alexandrium_andersonii.AAC.1